MEAEACFGRTRSDSVTKLTRLFVPMLIDDAILESAFYFSIKYIRLKELESLMLQMVVHVVQWLMSDRRN